MKKITFRPLLGILVLICVLFFTSGLKGNNASNKIETRTMKIEKNFTGLKAQQGMEITYTQNNKSPVALITGPKNIIKGITGNINKEGVLSFRFPKNIKKIKGTIKIQLNGKMLNDYGASSSGSLIVITEVKNSGTLNFTASSSGKIKMLQGVSGKEINIATSSSGSVRFEGNLKVNKTNVASSSGSYTKMISLNTGILNYAGSSSGMLNINSVIANNLNATVSSGGEIEVYQCQSENTNIVSSSGAEVDLKNINTKNLSLSASSGGTINVTGQCRSSSMIASSSGSINAKGLISQKVKQQSLSSGGTIKL